MAVWSLKVILTSIHEIATLLCNRELSKKSQPKLKSMQEKASINRQGSRWRSSHISHAKKAGTSVSSLLSLHAWDFIHLFSWIILNEDISSN